MTLKEKLACCAGAAVSALAMVACMGLLSQGKAAWSVGVIASMALAVILGRAGGLIDGKEVTQ